MLEILASIGRKNGYIVLKVIQKLKKARYSQIERELVNMGFYIPPPTLTKRLKEFLTYGLIEKVFDDEVDEKVYTLTPFGEEVLEVFAKLEEIYNKYKDKYIKDSTSR
jgi:DNA-binding HxlR family transcriptional regulator